MELTPRITDPGIAEPQLGLDAAPVVSPGYKQTEVGMIPSSWTVSRLQDVCREQITYGIVQCGPNIENGIPYIRVSDMNNRELDVSGMLRTSPAIAAQFSRSTVEEGDIVYALRGKIGEVRTIGHEVAGANLTQGTARIAPAGHIDTSFLVWVLRGASALKQAELEAKGSTFREITLASLRHLLIPLPPTLAEQQAIAAALGDADAYIDALAQRIAKQRLVKQGAMQALLRPKATDEVRNLADVSTLKGRIGWQGLKQTEFTTNENEPFLITGMNFKDGAIRWAEVYHISEERYEMAKEIQLRTGDVLMTKDGTIGKVLYIDEIPPPGKASLNSHLLLFRPVADSYHPKYLYYQLNSKRFKDFIELSKSGSTFFGISQAAVGMYPVLLPPAAEQIAIATVLSDMDAAIEALEAKLAKARLVKLGMMQELLTGRVRLV